MFGFGSKTPNPHRYDRRYGCLVYSLRCGLAVPVTGRSDDKANFIYEDDGDLKLTICGNLSRSTVANIRDIAVPQLLESDQTTLRREYCYHCMFRGRQGERWHVVTHLEIRNVAPMMGGNIQTYWSWQLADPMAERIRELEATLAPLRGLRDLPETAAERQRAERALRKAKRFILAQARDNATLMLDIYRSDADTVARITAEAVAQYLEIEADMFDRRLGEPHLP